MKQKKATPLTKLAEYSQSAVKYLNPASGLRNYKIIFIGMFFAMITGLLHAQLCQFSADIASGTRGCAPFRVVITNQCIGVDSIAWYLPALTNIEFTGDSIILLFKDGTFYEEVPTLFTFGCLDSTGNDIGHQDFEYQIDPAEPVTLLSDTVMLGEPVTLSRGVAGLTVRAFFGDGTYDSSLGSLSHTYAAAGTYHITVPVHTFCVDTQRFDVCVKCPVEQNCNYKIEIGPTLGGSQNVKCLGSPDMFWVSGCSNIANIKWNFGDGHDTSVYSYIVEHVYTQSGYYPVSAEIIDKCGSVVTIQDTFEINVITKDYFPQTDLVVNPYPKACVNHSVSIYVPGINLNFYDAVLITTGDGNNEYDYGMSNTYRSPGIYTINFLSMNLCGGIHTLTKDITILDSAECGSIGLPEPWQTRDVGSISVAGNASINNGTYTLAGSGADIWSRSDAFRYVYQQVTGDCNIVARLSSIQGGTGLSWAKAGLMIRDSLTAGAKYASALVTPLGGNKHIFQRRLYSGGWTYRDTLDFSSVPVWLRLNRTDNTFRSYYSTDSVTWKQIGSSIEINMGSSVYIGLVVTSHNNIKTCTALFDKVTVTTKTLPIPWATKDIGAAGVTGNATFDNGSFRLVGSGADIWAKADAFRYVYRRVTGNCDIVACLASLQSAPDLLWTKAGVMIRDSLTPGSKNAFTLVTPLGGNKHIFQRRMYSGGWTSRDTLGLSSVPVWLRLNRTGNTFTSYYSTDSITWKQIGAPVNIDMGQSVYAGLAITSHNKAKTCAVTFDRIAVTEFSKSAPASVVRTEQVPFSVWPNPANNLINIEVPLFSMVHIKNINGKSVFITSVEAGSTQIPLELPSGFYIIQVIDENRQVYSTKLVIE